MSKLVTAGLAALAATVLAGLIGVSTREDLVRAAAQRTLLRERCTSTVGAGPWSEDRSIESEVRTPAERSGELSAERTPDLDVPALGAIEGRVHLGAGERRARVMLNWSRSLTHSITEGGAAGNTGANALQSFEWLEILAPSDPFRFDGLVNGEYSLAVQPTNLSELTAHLNVHGNIVRHDLFLPEPQWERGLVVRGFGPAGELLANLRFSWESRKDGFCCRRSAACREFADGRHFVPRDRSPQTQQGESIEEWLCVESEDFGARKVEVEWSRTQVDLDWRSPAFLNVDLSGWLLVRDEGSSLLLCLQSVDSGTVIGPLEVADTGCIRLGPIQPGPVRWKIERRDCRAPNVRGLRGETLWQESSSLHEGPNFAQPMLDCTAQLRVFVPEGRPGDPIVLVGADPQNLGIRRTAYLEHRRESVVSRLPPGRYDVSARAGERWCAPTRVTVPQVSFLEIRPAWSR